MTRAMKALPFLRSTVSRLRLVEVEQAWTISEAEPVSMPASAVRALFPYFANQDREQVVVLHLDSTHRPISAETVAVGTLTQALLHPREVFKGAILANARAIIVAHNHPSGDVEPSDADRKTLELMEAAAKLLQIPLLDFLIISNHGYWSASNHGLLDQP